MAEEIRNPLGAYDQTATKPQQILTFKAGGTIAKGNVVRVSGTEAVITCTSTAATDKQHSVVGVALNAANSTTGPKVVQVAVGGIVAAVPVDGATAVGAILKASATTDGSLAATATPGASEGIAISLAASASNATTVYIAKNIALS